MYIYIYIYIYSCQDIASLFQEQTPQDFPGDGGKSYPKPKIYSFPPIKKIPLNRFKSYSTKSFQVITLCNLHL